MKQFLSFVKKEFYHILRDRRTMLILLAMPVVLIILFGFAITTEVNNIRFAVYTPTNDDVARAVTERFSANKYFSLVGSVTDHREIDALFRNNEADLVVVFEDGFGGNVVHTGCAAIQLIIDGTEPNTASLITGYAMNVIASLQQEYGGGKMPYNIVPEVKLLYNPQMKSAYNFVPGVMGLILMLICAMMTSISIVREKERGTMEVLLVSPVRPMKIILSKAVPYFIISVLNLTTILLLSVYLLEVPVTGSLLWLLVVSLIFIAVALSLGLLISSVAQTQVAAMLASGLGLMLPTMVLSGMIFPIENMPWPLQYLSSIVPAKWYIASVRKIMIQGLPIGYALKELVILCSMAVVLIALSLKKFKTRLG